MVAVAEVLHLCLGWPLWSGVVIVSAFLNGPGLMRLLGQEVEDNEERFVRNALAL
jgi:hypothetical protein